MINSSDILKANILIVDDREANIAVLDQMLRGAGYVSITSTTDPHTVGDLHRQHRYSLILLDLEMPGLDGFEVLEGLKAIETEGYLPVLAITVQPNHKIRALKAGAKDFVSKPFDLAEVLARVHNLLEVRLLHMEAKILYGQLQTANDELQAFSYSVSHDLRAPLRHVMGFVELLQQEAGATLPEICVQHLKTIFQSAKRMGILIDDLLAFSRLGRSQVQKSAVNLNQLVRETQTNLQADSKGRNVSWEVAPLPEVMADPAMLRQVLVNLLSNAVKFTGGRAEAKIEVGNAPDLDGETVIFIRDNGVGFDPRYLTKLFGVFQRLHSSEEFEGTGIGLANVQRIIQRHGGRTWAEGVVDGGATFYFSIPKRNGGLSANGRHQEYSAG